MSLNLWDYAPEDLEVTVSELLIATAASSDALIDDPVREVLHELRQHLGMDVIFLSEIRGGQRLFKHVDACPGAEVIATGGGAPVEQSFCQFVLGGRLPRLVHDAATHPAAPQLPATPFRVGAHLSTPIVLADGRVYGTLCSFSFAGDESLSEGFGQARMRGPRGGQAHRHAAAQRRRCRTGGVASPLRRGLIGADEASNRLWERACPRWSGCGHRSAPSRPRPLPQCGVWLTLLVLF